MRNLVRRGLFVASLLALGACGSPAAPDCSGDVDVSVTHGLRPIISWSPRCAVSSLTINTVPRTNALPESVWGFSVPESDPIGPSIIYGAVPENASYATAAAPLQRGMTYSVTVMLTVGGDGIVAYGTRTFQP
jgi:hypothetical protein